mmetsp:Transcript_19635/g.64963  ORF Transcript_19635/g.64963 Transcript_19635/m.64963 type:complete len:233 (-) Transcript_19635:13-711(-)
MRAAARDGRVGHPHRVRGARLRRRHRRRLPTRHARHSPPRRLLPPRLQERLRRTPARRPSARLPKRRGDPRPADPAAQPTRRRAGRGRLGFARLGRGGGRGGVSRERADDLKWMRCTAARRRARTTLMQHGCTLASPPTLAVLFRRRHCPHSVIRPRARGPRPPEGRPECPDPSVRDYLRLYHIDIDTCACACGARCVRCAPQALPDARGLDARAVERVSRVTDITFSSLFQ